MTFYQELNDIIKENLEVITNWKVNTWNDVTTNFMHSAPEEDTINIVIKTGTGITSKVKNLNMTSYAINLMIIVNQNSLQNAIDYLTQYVNTINGEVYQTETQDFYNLGFETPSVVATNQIAHNENGEVKTATINLIGNCIVSQENIAMPAFELDGKPIDRMQSYTDTYSLDYSPISEQDEDIDDVYFTGATRTWQITLIKDKNSPFQKWLDVFKIQYIGTKMVLKVDKLQYGVVVQNVSEALSQSIGVPVIVMTLLNVRVDDE